MLSLALGLSLLGLGAPPAAADSSTELPVASHTDIVVDAAHQRVFISDAVSGSVVVTDYDGTLVQHITSEPGASGLVLSPDSSTLYVALRTADAISAIDTATLRETARYATGPGTAPTYPAVAGGKIWFGYGTEAQGNIGWLDVSGPQPVVALDRVGRTWYSAPMLATSPGAPGRLVAGEVSTNPSQLAVYDVAGDFAQRTAYTVPSGGSVADLAVTPDGSEVVVATGAPYYHRAFRLSDLTESARYTTDAYPNAVAITQDGTAIAAGINGAYDPDIYLFRPGVDTQIRSYDFPSSSTNSTTLQPNGLAWAPDNSRLFALTKTYDSPTLTLRILNDPAKTPTTLTLDAPATAAKSKRLTINGTLRPADPAWPLPAGTTVRVTRYDYSLPEEGLDLGTHTIAPDGTFSFSDRPDYSGPIHYTVRYAGDPQHTAATATAVVNVS
ncbi:hypothetical protein GCM10023237_02190 [Streptomyces coeruleoprunus]|uniref:YncE family protein n=1 Tax=Streptomyces coeruleoprunus TaxID=285563 RepID=UPI0031EF94EA